MGKNIKDDNYYQVPPQTYRPNVDYSTSQPLNSNVSNVSTPSAFQFSRTPFPSMPKYDSTQSRRKR